MKILIVVGSCLKVNSSANLCHCAYIRGLVEGGHDVTVLSMSDKNWQVDNNIELPHAKYVTYNGTPFYHSLMKIQNNNLSASSNKGKTKSIKSCLLIHLKRTIKSLYGVHDIQSVWIRKANKYRSDQEFDYVVSLAWPPASHRLTAKLLHRKHISCKYWIEIWEDPWQADLYSTDRNERKKNEERNLVSLPNKVIYVSPITLKNQQEMFPNSSEKMIWLPLPYYYKKQYGPTNNSKLQYGYYGDYHPHVRNLKPFYVAAQNTQINANIVGNPPGLFAETEKIKIKPRVGLQELEKLETKTDVLVFVCNLSGGQIPGKIYQYSATNKIILFVLDGTQSEKNQIREYFGKFNRYIFCENTVESIEYAIRQIENGKISSINNEPIESFSPANIARSILENCK